MPSLMEILGMAGNALDLPGSSVRDLFRLQNPLDQWATPLSDENRTSGRDLMESMGLSGPAAGIGGFGAEMLLDPTNLIGGGLAAKLLKRFGQGSKATAAAEAINQSIGASNRARTFGVRANQAAGADIERLVKGSYLSSADGDELFDKIKQINPSAENWLRRSQVRDEDLLQIILGPRKKAAEAYLRRFQPMSQLDDLPDLVERIGTKGGDTGLFGYRTPDMNADSGYSLQSIRPDISFVRTNEGRGQANLDNMFGVGVHEATHSMAGLYPGLRKGLFRDMGDLGLRDAGQFMKDKYGHVGEYPGSGGRISELLGPQPLTNAGQGIKEEGLAQIIGAAARQSGMIKDRFRDWILDPTDKASRLLATVDLGAAMKRHAPGLRNAPLLTDTMTQFLGGGGFPGQAKRLYPWMEGLPLDLRRQEAARMLSELPPWQNPIPVPPKPSRMPLAATGVGLGMHNLFARNRQQGVPG